jgi:arylsulfatase A-like enzyme
MRKDYIERPNILLVFTDQQRFDTISAHVNNFGASTPAMDTLVRRGVTFANAFCTTPICSASRSTLITGLYPSQTGILGNIGAPSGPLSEAIPTVGDRLQALGYETVYHGKWHLGGDIRNYGFERAVECSHDQSVVDEASRFYRDRDWLVHQRPFFHVVSLLNPHDIYFMEPGVVMEPKLPPWPNAQDDLTGKPWPQARAAQAAGWSPGRIAYYRDFYRRKVEKADAEIGRLLDELVCSGFGPNTFIFFFSDHGDMACEHGIPFKGPFLYDGVVRVPLVIAPPWHGMGGATPCDPRWKNFQPRVESAPVSLADLVPTVLDLAGGKPDPNLPGRSLAPVLWGKPMAEREAVFAQWHQWAEQVTPIRMVRSAHWKYTNYIGIGEELYDAVNDPGEIANRVGDASCRDVLAHHRALLKAHCEAIRDPFFGLKPSPAP